MQHRVLAMTLVAGQPGRGILRCKGWDQDPNAYTYFIIQAAVWERVCDVIGEPEWKTKEAARAACLTN